ncbi:hypothetical protein GRAQ_02676 [Rahnella aquatilis CIP 78.65 = ATCC 33071]|uniref:Uncharacterized protein n=1 Tax=Rahnella aquatilis (strain ATCC 33071 / DSM 4594 / JCM 1683 / NBRC 105701 / NCIMB 13365 / CIP 78.65) TaxID=745277 RepID=H2IPE1_RAHAC|nr:RAQPRD family integrative conjugative element protein [Rahnella aquatilis]AEX53449.1 Plasmid protein of unknown function (Plasmid_RAQPRD) [Rahnella aquatilis CIP 78.65 = ATCC 33071]KFD03560.1 hypothetical protein GRAQ_02676 [Rahnella aquatilis CIP 78.65 = ATCC 33071]
MSASHLALKAARRSTFPIQASEKDELALVMRQLDQVQAGLDRARVVANQNGQDARFYFDYLSANRYVGRILLTVSLPDQTLSVRKP